jgi:hypothetical protein
LLSRREVLLEHLLFTERLAYADYGHIWFPDDDLEFARGAVAIEDLFANAGLSCADVFQPAIQNQNYSPAWEATRLIPGAYAHRTNIVEIMAHGFSGAVFETCYLTAIHVYDFMKSGWGLEPIWTKIGEALLKRQLRTIVFDCVPIVHTRPLGSGITAVHQYGRYEAQFVPQIHTNRMQTLEVFESLQEMLRQQLKPITRDADKIESVHRTLFGKFSGR